MLVKAKWVGWKNETKHKGLENMFQREGKRETKRQRQREKVDQESEMLK